MAKRFGKKARMKMARKSTVFLMLVSKGIEGLQSGFEESWPTSLKGYVLREVGDVACST